MKTSQKNRHSPMFRNTIAIVLFFSTFALAALLLPTERTSAQTEVQGIEDFEYQPEPSRDAGNSNDVDVDKMLTTPMEERKGNDRPPAARRGNAGPAKKARAQQLAPAVPIGQGPATSPKGQPQNVQDPGLEPGEMLIAPHDPKLAEEMMKKKALVNLDFIEGQIQDIVRYIADQTNRNFIINEQVARGTVTILSPKPLTQDEAYNAFLSALEVRGLATVQVGKFIKIIRSSDSRRSPIPIYTKATPSNDAFVTRVVQLKYVNVKDMSTVVKDMLSRDGDVSVHQPTNMLIITDSAANIQKILRMLAILDIKGFETSVDVIRIRNASAEDIARKVTELYPPNVGGGMSSGRPAEMSDFQGQEKIVKIIADERTNSIIILANTKGIETVKKFIETIDTPLEGTSGQIHVYHLKNVKAEDISNTLAALVSGRPGAARKTGPFGGGAPPSQPGGIPSKQLSAEFSDEVKITADVTTNSLVIIASPRDYEILRQVIEKLDIRRKQVFVESIIMEVSLNKGLDVGGHFQGGLWRPGYTDLKDSASGRPSVLFGNLGSGSVGQSGLFQKLLTDPMSLAGAALGFRSGKTIALTGPDGKEVNVPLVSAILQLAATSNNYNIISTPHLLATANEDATITVGQTIPVKGNTTMSTTGTLQGVDTKKIQTELKIKPQISEGDYLTLEVEQNIEQVKTEDYNGLGPSTTTRTAKTTMIVKDHQTAVFGGLMQNSETTYISKVPLLGDIPIIGWLFKSKNKKDDRTNLLLFLTPHIIRDIGDMKDTFYRKVRERMKFVEEVGMSDAVGKKYYGLTEAEQKRLDGQIMEQLNNEPLERLPSGNEAPAEPYPSVPQPKSEAQPPSGTAPPEAGTLPPSAETKPLEQPDTGGEKSSDDVIDIRSLDSPSPESKPSEETSPPQIPEKSEDQTP